MFAPNTERNKALVKLRDEDPTKYSFGVLGDMFKISKITAYDIYHKEKGTFVSRRAKKSIEK